MKQTLEKFLKVNCDVSKLPEVFGPGEWHGKSYKTPELTIAWRQTHVFHVFTKKGRYVIDKHSKKIYKYDRRYILRVLLHYFNNSTISTDRVVREFCLEYENFGDGILNADGYEIVLYSEKGELYIDGRKALVRNKENKWEKV